MSRSPAESLCAEILRVVAQADLANEDAVIALATATDAAIAIYSPEMPRVIRQEIATVLNRSTDALLI